jgi:hypothetical protein
MYYQKLDNTNHLSSVFECHTSNTESRISCMAIDPLVYQVVYHTTRFTQQLNCPLGLHPGRNN